MTGAIATPVKTRRRARRGVSTVAILVMLVVCQIAVAQEAGAPVIEDAEPYRADEFPGWALDLRRAEIVATGSFPLTILASRLLYGLGRFAVESIVAGGLAPAYLPPLFAPPGAQPYDGRDHLWILLGAISLSSVIATIDYVLGLEEPPVDDSGQR